MLWKTVRKCGLLVGVGGAAFQVGCALNQLSQFNPCFVILACDPAQYQLTAEGVTGPGLQVDLDPFCTYPGFCDATQDPLFGDVIP